MLSFTIAQQQLIEADWKKVSWKFQITDTQTPANTYYWSTKTISGTPDYEFKIIPESFRGVKVNRCKSEMGMIAALVECSFQIHNKDNTLDPLDFFDATGIITCELTDDVTTASRSWNIRVVQCTSLKQRLTFSCVDGFKSFLEGNYPTGGKVSDLFRNTNNMPDDDVCLPEPFGFCYIPLRMVVSSGVDYYLLGTRLSSPGVDLTYTIYGQKTPRSYSANQDEYTSSSYTFSQSNIADAYGIDRKAFQNDIDGGNNAQFGIGDQFFHDVPTCFRRSARLYGLYPSGIISLILDDVHQGLNGEWSTVGWYSFGADDLTAASVFYAAWEMEWMGAIWKVQSKEKLIANLLQGCHSTVKAECVDPNSAGYGVLIKASQKTITQKDVIQGSFQRQLLTKEINDSGYVAFPDLGPESLNETDFSTHANWDVTNDCDDTGGKATWTFSGGLASTLTQTSANLLVSGIGKRLYRLTYKVSGVTGAPTANITTSFADSTTALLIANGLQHIVFASANTPGDFVITSTLTAGQAFSIDYIHLQTENPLNELTQILVPCKEGGSMASPSNEVLELPFIRDSIMAQKIGILHFQRKFLKMAQIRFSSKARLFAIQPDDMITIDEDDYGGTYDVLVDSMFINKNLTIEMECTQFSDYLDDYDDLTPTAITKAVVTPQAAIMASPARMFMADFTATPVKSGQVLKTWFWSGNIADDASITCPTITTNGFMIITGGVTDKSCAMIAIQADGNYTVLFASGLYAYNADTDTKLCIGTAVQNPLIIKNRLGSTKNIIVLFWYN